MFNNNILRKYYKAVIYNLKNMSIFINIIEVVIIIRRLINYYIGNSLISKNNVKIY